MVKVEFISRAEIIRIAQEQSNKKYHRLEAQVDRLSAIVRRQDEEILALNKDIQWLKTMCRTDATSKE